MLTSQGGAGHQSSGKPWFLQKLIWDSSYLSSLCTVTETLLM